MKRDNQEAVVVQESVIDITSIAQDRLIEDDQEAIVVQ